MWVWYWVVCVVPPHKYRSALSITRWLLHCCCWNVFIAFSSAWTWHLHRIHYFILIVVFVLVFDSIFVYWYTYPNNVHQKLQWIMVWWIVEGGEKNDLCMRCTHFNVISSPFTSTLFHPNESISFFVPDAPFTILTIQLAHWSVTAWLHALPFIEIRFFFFDGFVFATRFFFSFSVLVSVPKFALHCMQCTSSMRLQSAE